jgi:hypothetical protein
MKKFCFALVLIIMIAMTLTPVVSYAGGDQNTNRGSVGEQTGEPTPDPSQDPDKTRQGDPNPDQDNVP